MKRRARFLLGVGLVFLLLPGSGTASASQDEERQFIALAKSQEEVDAMRAIEAETDATTRLGLTEAFLAEYPDSELTNQVLGMRMQAYVNLEDHRGAIDTAPEVLAAQAAFDDLKRAQFLEPEQEPDYPRFRHDSMNRRRLVYQALMGAHRALGNLESAVENGELALDTLEEDWTEFSPTLAEGSPGFQEAAQIHQQTELFLLQMLMASYQSLNDADKAVEYGERALELDPQNLATLITVSSTMAERPPADEDARDDHFVRAEEYAEDALETLEQFLAGPGAQMGAEQRASLLSGAHSTLGLVYLNQQRFGDAQGEYLLALAQMPSDDVAYFRLGEAYVRDNKADEALQALARSVYLEGVTEQPARELLEQIYQIMNQSLDGLEEFIEIEGRQIGNDG